MDARPAAPLLGWVGGKAWCFSGYTTENDLVSMRKQTTSGNATLKIVLPQTKEAPINDDTLWLHNPTIFNLSA